MTMDKSLKIRAASVRARSVLSRAERLERLKSSDRWKEGDSPLGLAKVRVYKLALKKKKKKAKGDEEEGAEGATPAAGAAAGKGAAPGKGAAAPGKGAAKK